MPTAATPDVGRTDLKHRRSSLQWALIAVLVALGCGFLVMSLSAMPVRWQVFPIAGAVLLVAALLTNTRKFFFILFILSLSVNANFFITTPRELSYVGNSSPTAFYVALATLTGALLLGYQLLFVPGFATEFRWARPVTQASLAVLGTMVLSTLLSGPYRFYGGCATLEVFQLYFIFLVALNSIRSEADFRFAISMVLVMLALQCVVFFLQLFLGVSFDVLGKVVTSDPLRATGTVGTNPSGFATFIEPPVLIALAIFRTTTSRRLRLFAGVLGAVGLLAVLCTLNRSSWAGIVLGIAAVEAMCRLWLNMQGPSVRRLALIACFLGAAFAIALPRLERREVDNESDLGKRVALMKVAVNMIAHNPVVGVGPGAYGFVMDRYSSGLPWRYYVHNDYLLVWAERGTLGFVAWALWLVAGIRLALIGCRETAPRYRAIAIGGLAALIVHMWEICWNSYEPLLSQAMIWIVVAILAALPGLARAENRATPLPHSAAA